MVVYTTGSKWFRRNTPRSDINTIKELTDLSEPPLENDGPT